MQEIIMLLVNKENYFHGPLIFPFHLLQILQLHNTACNLTCQELTLFSLRTNKICSVLTSDLFSSSAEEQMPFISCMFLSDNPDWPFNKTRRVSLLYPVVLLIPSTWYLSVSTTNCHSLDSDPGVSKIRCYTEMPAPRRGALG